MEHSSFNNIVFELMYRVEFGFDLGFANVCVFVCLVAKKCKKIKWNLDVFKFCVFLLHFSDLIAYFFFQFECWYGGLKIIINGY